MVWTYGNVSFSLFGDAVLIAAVGMKTVFYIICQKPGEQDVDAAPPGRSIHTRVSRQVRETR